MNILAVGPRDRRWAIGSGGWPTGELDAPKPANERCADRGAMMPTRTRTRAQNRAHHITAERRANQRDRQARYAAATARDAPTSDDDEPPPF